MNDERESHDAEPEDLEVSAEQADDVKGGQATVRSGRRQLDDIVIVKTTDKSTP